MKRRRGKLGISMEFQSSAAFGHTAWRLGEDGPNTHGPSLARSRAGEELETLTVGISAFPARKEVKRSQSFKSI